MAGFITHCSTLILPTDHHVHSILLYLVYLLNAYVRVRMCLAILHMDLAGWETAEGEKDHHDFVSPCYSRHWTDHVAYVTLSSFSSYITVRLVLSFPLLK